MCAVFIHAVVYTTRQYHLPFPKTAFRGVSKTKLYTHFSKAQLRIMWKQFEINPYLSRTEAEELAKMFKVFPEKVLNWFQRQRCIQKSREVEGAFEGKHFLTILKYRCFLFSNDSSTWLYILKYMYRHGTLPD